MTELAQTTRRTGGAQSRSRPDFGSVFELAFTPTLLLLALGGLFAYLQSQQLDDIERREISRQEILQRLLEHLQLVAVSSALVIALAVPLGVLLTRPRLRRAATVVLPLANLGQAVPSIGVLALLAIWVGFGFQMAVVALVLISFLSVLRNTMVGLTAVDPALIGAARGMGLSKRVVLLRVELPLAVPVILAGIRVALILNVGSAALATYTNAGGLGNLIETGIALNRMPILLTGAVLTAALALAIDWLAGLAERVLRPRGL
jgi:osmoprotectant transport system permease protein